MKWCRASDAATTSQPLPARMRKAMRMGMVVAACLGGGAPALAQEEASAAAQANNPLANMTAFNLQNYYIGRQTGTGSSANQFWLRYAQPFSLAGSKWLMRASLPVNSFPVDGHHETGIGDLNVFAAYLMDTGNPAVSFGFGPQVTAPTASKKSVGSEKWSAGLVNVLFNASSHWPAGTVEQALTI